MHSRRFSRASGRARVLAALAALGLAVPGIASALEVDPAVAQVCLLKGKVLAQGRSDEVQGVLGLSSYRVEELKFSPLEVTIRGKKVSTDTAWRVVVNGGPFEVRSIPAVIWIGDQAVGWGQESPDLRSLSTIIFDRSLLREGAELSISYGEKGERTKVPARLALGGSEGKEGVDR